MYLKAKTNYGEDGTLLAANSDEDAARVQQLVAVCETVVVEHGRINLRSRGARTDGRFALDDAVSRNGRIRERLPLLGGGRHVRHAVAPGELEDVAVG